MEGVRGLPRTEAAASLVTRRRPRRSRHRHNPLSSRARAKSAKNQGVLYRLYSV
jgi:hypothetical protein